MQLTCPSCGAFIDPQNINVTTDLAQCTVCGGVFQVSSLVAGEAPPPVSSEPPPGSGLEVSRELNGVRIYQRRRGFGCGTSGLLIFSLFWLSFVGVWTWLAASADTGFALFSIPFWIVGISLAGITINTVTETQTLLVSRSGLQLDKKRAIRSRHYDWSWNEIQAFRRSPVKYGKGLNNTTQDGRPLPMVPAVSLTGDSVTFLETSAGSDQDWALRYLSAKLLEYRHG